MVAVLLAAVGFAARPAHSSSMLACTHAAATRLILREPAFASLRPALRFGGGVDTLICYDLTRDGVTDMAVTIASGGTAGDTAWVVFRQALGRWKLVLRELQVYKVGLFLVGSDLVESQPVYLKNDPNCCPTGGFVHRRFHWGRTGFVVVRRWHDSRFRPTP